MLWLVGHACMVHACTHAQLTSCDPPTCSSSSSRSAAPPAAAPPPLRLLPRLPVLPMRLQDTPKACLALERARPGMAAAARAADLAELPMDGLRTWRLWWLLPLKKALMWVPTWHWCAGWGGAAAAGMGRAEAAAGGSLGMVAAVGVRGLWGGLSTPAGSRGAGGRCVRRAVRQQTR